MVAHVSAVCVFQKGARYGLVQSDFSVAESDDTPLLSLIAEASGPGSITPPGSASKVSL